MNKKKIMRGVLGSLILNGAVPLLVYNLLIDDLGSVAALSIAALIPLLETAYSLLKHRRVDVFGGFMLIGFVLSIAAVLIGGDERLILIRESFVTGVLGLTFLGSLLMSRPLIYHFALRFTVGDDPERREQFAANWKYAYFRRVMRVMTAGWGIALIGEAFVRSILVFSLTVNEFLAVSNFVMYGFIGAAILWTVNYRRRSAKRLTVIKNENPLIA